MRTNGIEEVTIMGYNDDRILKLEEKILQPGNCMDVEVVGWLVKNKDIGISKYCLCK